MKPDYGFALLCWCLVLGPVVLALALQSPWWLALYVVTALIFGLA